MIRRARREVMERQGRFGALYRDRAGRWIRAA
jgi:hypothetical protein